MCRICISLSDSSICPSRRLVIVSQYFHNTTVQAAGKVLFLSLVCASDHFRNVTLNLTFSILICYAFICGLKPDKKLICGSLTSVLTVILNLYTIYCSQRKLQINPITFWHSELLDKTCISAQKSLWQPLLLHKKPWLKVFVFFYSNLQLLFCILT